MLKKNFFLNSFFFILIFFYISHGLNWGLPSNERIFGLFENKDQLLKESNDLTKVYQQERKKKIIKFILKITNNTFQAKLMRQQFL